jgi:alcohol dehydrogenase class IV
MSVADVADFIAEAVIGLSTALGVPQRLRDLQVPLAGLPLYAETALRDACMAANPRAVTKDDVLTLLHAAY